MNVVNVQEEWVVRDGLDFRLKLKGLAYNCLTVFWTFIPT